MNNRRTKNNYLPDAPIGRGLKSLSTAKDAKSFKMKILREIVQLHDKKMKKTQRKADTNRSRSDQILSAISSALSKPAPPPPPIDPKLLARELGPPPRSWVATGVTVREDEHPPPELRSLLLKRALPHYTKAQIEKVASSEKDFYRLMDKATGHKLMFKPIGDSRHELYLYD